MEIYYIIGQNIKKYRKLNSMTQEQLANKCNLSYGFIKNLEAKKVHATISIETLQLIANNLNIEITDLLKNKSD